MAEDLTSSLVFIEYNVSLSDDLYYTTECIVNDVRLFLTIGYSSRNKQRWLIIENSSGDVLLTQTFLSHGRRSNLNGVAEINNLSYYVTLKSLTNKTDYSDFDYEAWADEFTLCFVGQGYDQVLLLKENYRKVVVGN